MVEFTLIGHMPFAQAQQNIAEVQKRRAEEQTHAARCLRGLVATLVALVVLAIGTVCYAVLEQRRAAESARTATAAAKDAVNARDVATIAERNAQARASEAEAARAEANGQKDKARALELDAENYRKQAGDLQKQADASKSVASSVPSLQGELALEKGKRTTAEGQVLDLKAKLDAANVMIGSLQKQIVLLAKEQSEALTPTTENKTELTTPPTSTPTPAQWSQGKILFHLVSKANFDMQSEFTGHYEVQNNRIIYYLDSGNAIIFRKPETKIKLASIQVGFCYRNEAGSYYMPKPYSTIKLENVTVSERERYYFKPMMTSFSLPTVPNKGSWPCAELYTADLKHYYPIHDNLGYDNNLVIGNPGGGVHLP